MKLLAWYVAFASRVSRWGFVASCWLTTLLVILTVEQVLSRYLWNSSSMALQELEWHLFGFIICLSIAHTLDRNEHVRVDILSTRFSSNVRQSIHALGFLSLVPLCLALAYFGWLDVIRARSFSSGLPADHYTSLLLPEGSSLRTAVAAFEEVLRSTVLVGEGSPDAGGLEARWIVKSAFPLGMLLLSLQALALFLRSVSPSLRSHEEYRWI